MLLVPAGVLLSMIIDQRQPLEVEPGVVDTHTVSFPLITRFGVLFLRVCHSPVGVHRGGEERYGFRAFKLQVLIRCSEAPEEESVGS